MGFDSQRAATVALVGTGFGSGVLGMPWAFASTGLVVGLGLMVVAGLSTYASLRLLANASYATGQKTYFDVAEFAFGPSGGVLVDVLIFLYLIGSVVGYFVFLGQIGPLLLHSLNLGDWQAGDAILFVAAFAVLPLSLPRSLSTLRYAALLSTISLATVTAIIMVRTPQWSADLFNDLGSETAWLWMPETAFDWKILARAYSILLFAMCCHTNVFACYSDMREPVPCRVDKVMFRAIALMMVIYTAVGICGFISFGSICHNEAHVLKSWPSCTPTNVLAAPRFSGKPAIVARGCICYCLIIVTVLNLPRARGILSRRLCGSEDAPLPLHVAITVAIIGASTFVAMRYSNINDILGVLGGFGSVNFMFAIPVSALTNQYSGEIGWSWRPKGVSPEQLRQMTGGTGMGMGAGMANGKKPGQVMLVLYFRHPLGFGDRTRAPQMGSWLGVTKSGVLFVALLMFMAMMVGYTTAGLAVRDILAHL